MSTVTNHRTVGKYVRDVDDEMFRQISGHIGSRSVARVGEYVESCDPEMYWHIVEMEWE